MFLNSSIKNDELRSDVDESSVDDFTRLIQRAVQYHIRLRQKNRQALVFKKARPTFGQEIRCMMHIFGDVEYPLTDSVRLIEKILRSQMNLLLKKASRVSCFRHKTSITHEELVYLLRRKKDKLRRLFQYLELKDANDYICKKKYHEISGAINGRGKRVKQCVDFLNKLKGTKEFNLLLKKSLPDPLLTKRMGMRYLQTLEMEDSKYLEYSKKLQVSFLPSAGVAKFMNWLLADKVTNLVPTIWALEIISYLARETVAEIVESSISVQKNDYLPNSYQRYKMPNPSETCHPEHGTSASNSSVLSNRSEESMDDTANDCINDFMEHSTEQSESILPRHSNSGLENGTINDSCTAEGIYNSASSVEYPSRQSDISHLFLQKKSNLPLHPRSIREVMLRSAMSPNYPNTHVNRRKFKMRLLCI